MKDEPRISDEAVEAATGRDWDAWFRLLDAAGAGEMEHSAIAAWLDSEHQVSTWWRQMITVGYEQARGRRERRQRPEGFQIRRSRTVDVPLPRLFRAWSDDRMRRNWLSETEMTVRKATEPRSMRITWVDGETHLDVYFYERSNARSQVVVNHSRLPDSATAEQARCFWQERLDELQSYLEETATA